MKATFTGMLGLAVVLLITSQSRAGSYAQLSSSKSQVGQTSPTIVSLNSDDALKGLAHSDGTVTVKEAGTYFAIAAGQVGSARKTGKGSVRLWMRQNGKDVDNSNTEQTVTPGFTAVLVCQGVAECKAGDKLTLAFSVSQADEGLGLIATKPTEGPVIPSMILSLFKVADTGYAQLSSSETQPAGAAGKMVTLNSVDAAKNILNEKGVVTIEKAGTYFVIAAGQAGTTRATKAIGKSSVRLWVQQNGKDVDNSNTEQSISPGFTGVLVCQGVMECKAGDKVQLMQAASGASLGMIASAPKGEPAIPSMILSIFRVDDSAYAQLSSTETQSAAAAGKTLTLNQTDSAKEVDNSKGGALTVKKAGVYFAIAAGQAGATTEGGTGAVRLWMKQNGKDIDNSNTEQTLAGNYTSVLVCQGVGELKAGDKLELVQSAVGKGVGMLASKPKGEPAVPSVIFSLVRVD